MQANTLPIYKLSLKKQANKHTYKLQTIQHKNKQIMVISKENPTKNKQTHAPFFFQHHYVSHNLYTKTVCKSISKVRNRSSLQKLQRSALPCSLSSGKKEPLIRKRFVKEAFFRFISMASSWSVIVCIRVSASRFRFSTVSITPGKSPALNCNIKTQRQRQHSTVRCWRRWFSLRFHRQCLYLVIDVPPPLSSIKQYKNISVMRSFNSFIQIVL